MAYQFTDSFDYYNTAFLQAGSMWETILGYPTISTAYARFPAIGSYPNQGVSLWASSYPQGMRKNLKSNQASLIAFLSYGAAGGLPSTGYIGIVSLLDAGTCQITLALTPTGALQFVNYAGTPIGPASASALIAVSTVPNHGIEIAVTINGSTGSIECWLDGAIVIALTTGLNTQHSANAYANQIQVGVQSGNFGMSGGGGVLTDYVRVWDTTGSYQNAPVGHDVRKLTKLPIGAGALTQWTANGAASDWDCVNDASPDGDTTYVSSSGLNYDSYAMGSSGLSGVPSQVVVKSYVRKDDGATRTFQIGVRSGSSNGLGTAVTVGSSYQWVDGCISVDPATSSPPTAAAADAFQHLKYEAS
jgi:hypothetical protein